MDPITLLRSPVASCSALFGLVLAAGVASASPNTVDYAVYFDSEVHDTEGCAMTMNGQEVMIDKKFANPSMSCPDMFSWKLFADTVRQSWWTNWAADEQTWPAEPFALCEGGKAGPNCCLPGSADNPSQHCPVYPGDVVSITESASQPRKLSKPIGAHAISLGRGGLNLEMMTMPGKPGEPEPGRVLRQEVGEITVRNKDMFDYIFKNDLYNAQGVANVVERNQKNLAEHAPYQAKNPSGALSKIDLPVSAIMIKSNWLYHEFAKDIGLKDDPAAPYIKKAMSTELNGKTYTGEHWLLAFHISTKDTPQWVWTTFEHVNNPGRCDFSGCNDSYGYASPDQHPGETMSNFTAPHVRNDGLQQSSVIYDLGNTYPSGPVSSGLSEIFKSAGIGTTQAGEEPMPTDKGWLSYRLKGAQVNFTNAMGRATRLGNSITEGGFVTTSSCITCHARASVAASGDSKKPLAVPLGVFLYDQLSEVGYGQSAMGIPERSWYHGSGSKPSVRALQTDFMWGMPFFAKPVVAP